MVLLINPALVIVSRCERRNDPVRFLSGEANGLPSSVWERADRFVGIRELSRLFDKDTEKVSLRDPADWSIGKDLHFPEPVIDLCFIGISTDGAIQHA